MPHVFGHDSNLKWLAARTRVPGRAELSFTGEPMTVLWYYLGAVVLIVILNVMIARREKWDSKRYVVG